MLYVRQCVYRFELRRFLLHFATILVDGSFDLRRCHSQCYLFINHFKLNTWDGTLQTAKMTHYLKSIVVLRFDELLLTSYYLRLILGYLKVVDFGSCEML